MTDEATKQRELLARLREAIKTVEEDETWQTVTDLIDAAKAVVENL